jgi:transglutaminase-like putative cysteine protease
VPRTLIASLFPVLVVGAAWLALEDPRNLRDGLAVAVLALLPAVAPAGVRRVAAIVAATLGAAWIVFGAQPWELLPFRDERVVAPALSNAARGFVDFYDVFLPFEPVPNPEMHALVLCAIFGFTLAIGMLVAARRPLAAAAVTVAGVGWPATLLGGTAIAVGALALAAALAIPLILRASTVQTALAGGLVGALVVAGAAWTSSATTIAREAALDWESWDIRGETSAAPSVRFAWESNYDGIDFPTERTVVFSVTGPEQATYWRASTLNLFSEDHWFEHLLWLGRVEGGSTVQLAPGQLIPSRVSQRRNWAEPNPTRTASGVGLVEQEVKVGAFVDDHLVAAGTPLAIDARRLGTVFQLSGNVLRARDSLREGTTYRIWSYVPDPSPAELAAAAGQYPFAASRYLEVDGREFPPFGVARRADLVEEFFADRSYAAFRRYRPMYDAAQDVTRAADTPYETVLALESWFRQEGGFRYDESPPRLESSPLVGFVTRTKAGYCQHFAGAMAAMLRMLGVPARVAVGFTSGTKRAENMWVVTDHDAHAWVEVWFRGHGWIAFDPTPGRGTFGGSYSFASDSNEAVAALRRGELADVTPNTSTPREPDAGDLPGVVPGGVDERAPSLIAIALLLGALWVAVVGAGKALVRRGRYLSRDPQQIATASRRELEGFLRDQGVDVSPNAGLATLQAAVHRELGLDGRPFAIAAARARFGPPASRDQGAAAARKEVRRLIRSARGELSLWARFRGLVSVRSLRAA